MKAPGETFSTALMGSGPWQERLDFVIDMMRELSSQTDAEAMVRAYGARMRTVIRSDKNLSLSRRGLKAPHYRITRSNNWSSPVNPWLEQHKLPMFDRGLLGELIYADKPTLIDHLKVSADDPAYEYLRDMGSLIAIPLYDQGVATNMVVLLRKEPAAFDPELLPEHVWMANLFGRATHNLALSAELKRAYDALDRELEAVEEIQKSLLPSRMPEIPTLSLAAYYNTSTRAGGDYYDFFPLPNGQWGILIADVSGHGTPAAVLMAITHSIAHTAAEPKTPPSRLIQFVNETLCGRYTSGGSFVTAFYGIYDPSERRLDFCNAGHPPPRVMRHGSTVADLIEGGGGLPLGIVPGEPYVDATAILQPGDDLAFFTDGITEARNAQDELFGEERLDEILARCHGSPADAVAATVAAVEAFTGNRPPTDDRTLLWAQVT